MAQLFYQYTPTPLPHPGSDSQTTLFKEWLRVCEEQHNHQFNYKAGFPTRVLDVGTPEHPQIRLCDGTKAISKRYVALSHCWGTEQCFKTLKNNINDFKKEIGFKELPRTFQDAVKVTRDLGFRYLWIDSLCIIQDDLLDWEQEAASMEHVFSSAIVTIAASSAKSSAEGFLLAQRKQQTPVIIKTASNGTAFICKSIDDFHRDVEMSPLNKRGWVLQERALARRTLHFTSSQVYWECGNGIHGESLMKLVKAAFLGDSDFPNSALGYFKGARILLFQNLYRTYSALNFTHVTDRSIAIKGLEERLVKAFNTKGGFGIFERYLHRSLLWQRESDSPLVRITDPPGTHIPSWSWMAYSGRISYLEAPFDGINWQDYVQSPLTSESGVKQHWKADQISIVGYMLRGPMRKLNLEATELGGRITFDQEERATVRDLGCIVLGVKRLASLSAIAEHYVLIIEPISSGDTTQYKRAGVGILLPEHMSEDAGIEVVVS
ncbi:HET-domain-containing protein [Colletotrichum sublineola]|nr:HET-domain-containing protein [Colletotrichum sublineola]